MQAAQFNELVVKVLGGEASPEETERMHELVRSSPEFQLQFEQIRSTWRTLKDVLPLAQAMDTPAADVPPRIMVRLQDQLRAARCVPGTQLSSTSRERIPSASREADGPTGGREGVPASAKSPRSSPHWLIDWWKFFALHQGVGFAGLALVLCLGVVGVIWLGQRAQPTMPTQRISAYLVIKTGQAQLWHAGKDSPVQSSAPLRTHDKVHLEAGAIAELITEKRRVELVGPKEVTLEEALGDEVGKTTVMQTAVEARLVDKKVQTALFGSIDSIDSSTIFVATRDYHPIPLYSPLGMAGTLTPIIRWRNEPDKQYDLEIVNEFPPKAVIVRLSGVTSPVDLSKLPSLQGKALPKRGLYRIVLKETGNRLSASEFTFETGDNTVPQGSSSPGDRLAHACQVVMSKPSDARQTLEELLSLPPSWSSSELALRLKLFIFGQLGYKEDFDAVKAALERIPDSQ